MGFFDLCHVLRISAHNCFWSPEAQERQLTSPVISANIFFGWTPTQVFKREV
jgi:hypothetical protein